MQKFFRRDSNYEIVHRNLYNVHQRVASTFRLGRVLLAGDSAHLNNSIGGKHQPPQAGRAVGGDLEENATFLFKHTVTGLEQSASGVKVFAETPDGPRSFEADYLIGADGGKSAVRKSAGIEFQGFTCPERFLVLSTPFDFEKERGMSYRRICGRQRHTQRRSNC